MKKIKFNKLSQLRDDQAYHTAMGIYRLTNWKIIKFLNNHFSINHIFRFSLSSFIFFPLWFITGYWMQIPVLYSQTLLFTHPIYNRFRLLILRFQSIPLLLLLPLGKHKSLLCVWVCFCFIDRLCQILFYFYVLILVSLSKKFILEYSWLTVLC